MKKSKLFDLYLQNKLDEKQLQEFKSNLSEDPEFNRDFQSIKEIRYAIRHNARLDIRKRLDAIEASIEDTAKPKFKTKIVVALALVAIILISLSIHFLTEKTLASNAEIYESYYELPEIEDLIDLAKITQDSVNNSSILAFQSGNYRLANESFIKDLISTKQPELYILSGLSAMEVENYQLAVDQFNIVINHFKEYQNTALWYSALSFLALDNKVEAVGSLYELTRQEETVYEAYSIYDDLGIGQSERISVGLIETLFTERDTLENADYQVRYQKGIISDLTTRNNYEFYLVKPTRYFKVGEMVNYIALEEISDTNAIGIGAIQ